MVLHYYQYLKITIIVMLLKFPLILYKTLLITIYTYSKNI